MAFRSDFGRHFLLLNSRKPAWLLGLKAGIFIDHEEGVGWSQVKDKNIIKDVGGTTHATTIMVLDAEEENM